VKVALDIVALVAGVFLLVVTVLSVIRSTILPRSAPSRVTYVTSRTTRALFQFRAKRARTYEERDRIMAMLGPVSLLALLVVWLILLMTAYTLIYLSITHGSLADRIRLSGASIFTLGTASDARLGPSLVTYSEAALGLFIVALLITYLPSIYNAFSRREAGVSLLSVRAGTPPQAATMLIRYHRIEEPRYRLGELWRQWESWFIDIEESHTTFPILVFFRSPLKYRSWVTAAGALLDAASFWAGCVEHPLDPDVQLCIRAGFLALRRIADSFKIPYDPEPPPDGPITISREEWEAAMDEMAEAGMPLKTDRDEAWAAWKGWRVNYDTVLLRLARLVEAPITPWESDRTPTATAVSRPSRASRTPIGPGQWRRK
jgi:hypothetical protein